MKKIIFTSFLLLFFIGFSQAQILNPVKWKFTAKKISTKVYELHMTATLDPKWHIYAQEAGEGPEPTAFTFAANPLIKVDGKVREVGKMEKTFDPNFNSTLKYYAKKVDFVQKVKLKSSAATLIKGSVSYMVCDDKKCLPPKDLPFIIQVKGK